LPKKHVQLRHI